MAQSSTRPMEMDELLPPVQIAAPKPPTEWNGNAGALLKFTIITAMPLQSPISTFWHHALKTQTHQNWEHIVLEYGGTDSKAMWHAGYSRSHCAKPIVPLYSKTEALNKGLSLGTGDIIAFLPLSCVYKHKDVLSKVAQRMVNPEVDLVYGDVECVTRGKSTRVLKAGAAGASSRQLLGNGMLPFEECVFVRSDWWQFFGGLDTSFQHAAGTARLLDLLTQPGLRIDYLDEVLVRSVRKSDASNSNLVRMREDVIAFSKRKLLGTYLTHRSLQQRHLSD